MCPKVTHVLKQETAHSSVMRPLSIKSSIEPSRISKQERFLLFGRCVPFCSYIEGTTESPFGEPVGIDLGYCWRALRWSVGPGCTVNAPLCSSWCANCEHDELQALPRRYSTLSRDCCGEFVFWGLELEFALIWKSSVCISCSCWRRNWTSDSTPSSRLSGCQLVHSKIVNRREITVAFTYSETGSFGISKKTHCLSSFWHLDASSAGVTYCHLGTMHTFHMAGPHHT